MKCLYCLSKKIIYLKNTCYCEKCSTYFKITENELEPIYIETEEKDQTRTKTEDTTILCSTCQEKEEEEYRKTRKEELYSIEIPENTKSKQKLSTLCKICIDKVTDRLKRLEKHHEKKYNSYLLKKKTEVLLVFTSSIIIYIAGYKYLSILIPSLWDIYI